MQQHSPTKAGSEQSSESVLTQKIAENPNPRANENIQQTSFEEKNQSEPGNDVGTEITDGEAG